MKNDEGWRMNDEVWWFQAVERFLWLTDKRTDGRTFVNVESLLKLKIHTPKILSSSSSILTCNIDTQGIYVKVSGAFDHFEETRNCVEFNEVSQVQKDQGMILLNRIIVLWWHQCYAVYFHLQLKENWILNKIFTTWYSRSYGFVDSYICFYKMQIS